jgi:hypothetical protein
VARLRKPEVQTVTKRKIMGSNWGFPPDGTRWVLDEQALDSHELINTRTVSDSDAERVSQVVINTFGLKPPFAEATEPMRVAPGPVAEMLADIFGFR